MRMHVLFVLLFSLIFSGCAYNRSEIKLGAPIATSTAPSATKKGVVVIRSVKDERIFEQSPSEPNIPSIGFAEVSKATPDELARTVGRKRNGFGRALADIQLQGGQTAASVVRENLTVALQQAGYQVKDEKGAGVSPIIIDVHVKQFWAWIEKGFMTLTLNAAVNTSLDISGSATPMTIDVRSNNPVAGLSDSAWVGIFEKALVDYRIQASSKVSELKAAK